MEGQASPLPKLDLVVIDCPDAPALARFYARVLGWEVQGEGQGDFVTVVPPAGGLTLDKPDGRTALAFQQIPDYVAPTWPGGSHPQQFHLDLSCRSIGATEPLVVAAGATVHEHQPSTDGGFRVYLDPAGHPFCLIL